MKVTVEFLSLPLITQPLGKKKIDMEFQGSTLSDLARDLGSKIKRAKDILLRSDGVIDDDIQIYINGDRVQREESDNKKLSEGDSYHLYDARCRRLISICIQAYTFVVAASARLDVLSSTPASLSSLAASVSILNANWHKYSWCLEA